MNDIEGLDARADLLNRARAYATTEPSFGRFLRAVVDATDPDDFLEQSASGLEPLFRQTYNRLGKRNQAPYAIYMPPEPGPGRAEIIEVFSDDMPFIVDSVLAAIRSRGVLVRLLSHPLVTYDPTTYRVLEKPEHDSHLESVLHIEIDPLPDAESRTALLDDLDATLTAVGQAVSGWRPMLDRLRALVEGWRRNTPSGNEGQLTEANNFLTWLIDHNFTFLGMREYRLDLGEAGAQLQPIADSGLGILADPGVRFLRSGAEFVETTPEQLDFFNRPEPLLVGKANLRSRVHRREHMDLVTIKLFDTTGGLTGELRLLGLFTSRAAATPNSKVPLLRAKIEWVMERAGLDPADHAGKALFSALESYPRDELFQIEPDQLFEFATLIAGLADRPRVRVLPRIDRFDNFVSVLVFVPRDRYDSQQRERIGAYLAQVYGGRVSAFYPSFPEGELVRVHYIIGRFAGRTPEIAREVLEQAVLGLVRSFSDRLLATAASPADLADFLYAFPADYQAQNSEIEALADLAAIRDLDYGAAIALRLAGRSAAEGEFGLKLFHAGTPLTLSDRVPLLENFGFRVIDERTYRLEPRGRDAIFIHDMVLAVPGFRFDFPRLRDVAETAILAVWHGQAESDGLNRLTLSAGLPWTDIEILRAMSRYLKQLRIPYPDEVVTDILARHPEVGTALVLLFHALSDPHFTGSRERATTVARDSIALALQNTPSLDEDRVIRQFRNAVEAVVRTNAYQRGSGGERRAALAIKFDPAAIADMPEPKPFREIFVYSPRLEGVHLRMGAIARGGLRWSDRLQDFRTEALGLVKAQQVKNAIIVPVGAKGAFVPKWLPAGGDRDAVQREGIAAYSIFVSALLDVTDDLNGEVVTPPPDVRRRDRDDPYLVVAADKGTASFSDTANAIALDRGYWLGDAFASGGSAGYDHKEMGITARGAWEAVKRHFRELGTDIQSEPFTVAGVGDMSGDVFGNGMLLSPQIRLVAAFDHRHIFIDPNPDPAASLAERQRLFELPRSSWADYREALLSTGGGIYPRTLKTVPLSPEARALLGLGDEDLAPNAVIRAILTARVDLLWFGGIGTYVRAATESEADAGDRSNDVVRVTGAELRAKVVGEGANLAVTQRGRIEYALAGGRINSDAIDNSAGVNSSDLEVNIKIALGSAIRMGQLQQADRNGFLASMTGEVAALCLRNNYLQTLALSMAEREGAAALPALTELMETLEDRGALNRALEFLPSPATLAARLTAGLGLTRPELSVLLAYSKNTLYADLLESSAPDEPYLARELYKYFPPTLSETFLESVTGHRLRREVIATVLANAMVNRGGPAFVGQLQAATSADLPQIARAFAATRDSFHLDAVWDQIDALDGRVAAGLQLEIYDTVQTLLRRETLWFLRNGDGEAELGPAVEAYAEGIATLKAELASMLPPSLAASVAAEQAGLAEAGVPPGLATTIAQLPVLGFGTDIALIGQRSGAAPAHIAFVFFGLIESFGLWSILRAAGDMPLGDRFDQLALDRALANLMRAQRDLTVEVLAAGSGNGAERLAQWRTNRGPAIERITAAVRDLTEGTLTVSRLTVAAGLMSDLARTA